MATPPPSGGQAYVATVTGVAPATAYTVSVQPLTCGGSDILGTFTTQ